MRRILVIKLSSLGDLLHALPAVHCVKGAFGADIDWVVNAEYAELVRCFTDVSRVIPLPRGALLRAGAEFLRELRRERYDLVADMQGLLKSAFLGIFARCGGMRLGPSFHREGSRLLYHAVCGARDKNRHAVEENMDLVRKLGLQVPEERRFPVNFPAQALAGCGLRLGMAPFARWENKNWPRDFFVRAALEVHRRTGAAVFIFGAKEHAQAAEEMRRRLGACAVDMAGKTSLPKLGGMLAAMSAVLTNDSGPMHLAAAAGVPVVAVFGPTDPVRTGPFGSGHKVLRAEGACRFMPCLSRRCRLGRPVCMEKVQPETAASAVVELLARSKQ